MSAAPCIEVRDLAKHYPVRRGLLRRTVGLVRAVDGVSFALAHGETLALVGESASGKTTVARALLALTEPSAGSVYYRRSPDAPAVDLLALRGAALRRVRRELAIVFQDPFESLNPRLAVGQALAEPLFVHGLARGAELSERVVALLLRVGLTPDIAARFPHQLSGGQRQRVAIARALALAPRFIVCDEAVSALDASVQAQILNLLADVQRDLGLAQLFIAHDLALVRHVAERVCVMQYGRIVESGTVAEVFSHPAHPYTRSLLEAAPGEGARRPRAPAPLAERPSPSALPSGCPHRTRCPLADALCAERYPETATLSTTHSAACHHPLTDG